MKNLFVLFLLSISPFLYAQEYRLGLNSNYISSISEDVPEYTYYNPIEKSFAVFGLNYIFKIDNTVPIYTGLDFQLGGKTIWDNILLYHYFYPGDTYLLKSKRDITLLLLKAPLLYSLRLFDNIYLYTYLNIGWTYFILNNSGHESENGNLLRRIKDRKTENSFLLEPGFDINLILFPNTGFAFGLNYKKIGYSVNSKLLYLETKYKYDLEGVYFTFGIYHYY